jgi:hypothetical protein
MRKFGSNVALCCNNKSLEILGTGGMGVDVGKRGQWHNLYACTNCNKVFYELADFGDVIQLFYSKKGTREYQKDLVENAKNFNPANAPRITKLLHVRLFVPVRGGVKLGIKTLKGYRAVWLPQAFDSLKLFTYEDYVKLGFDNIEKEDVYSLPGIYERKLKALYKEEQLA